MKRKVNLALITIGIVIAGAILVTGITRFGNKNKTEVNSNETSTSISEQVEQTPESSATSDIEIIEDETSISDDGLTSSNAGGNSDPVEVEVTEDGVVADKPEPYPDEWSLITQPEDSENSAESNETVIKDVGPTVDIENDPLNEGEDNILTADDLPSGQMSKEDFIKMVQESGTTLH
mgnify:CR=1 FL=1